MQKAKLREQLKELDSRDLLGEAVAICTQCHVTVPEMLGESRSKHVVRARTAFCAYLAFDCGLSSVCIGKLIGRDHTSVLHLLAKARGEIDSRKRNYERCRATRSALGVGARPVDILGAPPDGEVASELGVLATH